MGKTSGTGMNDYTRAMLGNDPDLLNADDGGDISGASAEPVVGRRNQPVVNEEVDDNVDDQEVEVDGQGEETPDEPTYKKEQVQKIVATRVNTFTKKLEKLTPYKEAFDRMSEITGMDVNALIGRLNTMSVEEQAAILGMKPEEVKAARLARTEIAQERGKNQTLARQLEETQLKTDRRYSDFDLFKEEIDEMIADNPKLSLKQAYTLVKGDTAIEAANRDAEQRQINKQVINRQKGIVKPGGVGNPQAGPKIDNATVAAARKVGMDPVEYANFQQIDNIDAYRAMKAKQKR